METMVKWHVWSVNVKHHRKILQFLKNLPQVVDTLIPIMEKEYIDKRSSKKRVKEIPLYGNYIFLKYKNDDELVNFLTSNQFFYRYLGECTPEEEDRIEEFKYVNYREFFKEEDLEPGMKVKLVKDPFAGLIGRIKNVSGKNVSVLLEFFGQPVEVKCKLDDLRTELWTASEE
jgi:transcription antitermination factor NusG